MEGIIEEKYSNVYINDNAWTTRRELYNILVKKSWTKLLPKYDDILFISLVHHCFIFMTKYDMYVVNVQAQKSSRLPITFTATYHPIDISDYNNHSIVMLMTDNSILIADILSSEINTLIPYMVNNIDTNRGNVNITVPAIRYKFIKTCMSYIYLADEHNIIVINPKRQIIRHDRFDKIILAICPRPYLLNRFLCISFADEPPIVRVYGNEYKTYEDQALINIDTITPNEPKYYMSTADSLYVYKAYICYNCTLLYSVLNIKSDMDMVLSSARMLHDNIRYNEDGNRNYVYDEPNDNFIHQALLKIITIRPKIFENSSSLECTPNYYGVYTSRRLDNCLNRHAYTDMQIVCDE